MSIRFREDRKKWEASVFFQGKRLRPLFESKREAQEFIRDIRLKKLTSVGIERPLLIGEAFKIYLETESRQKSVKTKKSDEWFFIIILQFFVKERKIFYLNQITLDDLERFQLWALQPQKFGPYDKNYWSDTTFARCGGLLKHFFKKMIKTGRLIKNPCEFWEVPVGESQRRRPMTHNEFYQIFEKSPEWFKPILAFIRLTGARGASAAALTWADIDFSKATLFLRSRKGGRKKMKLIPFPMYPELFNLLSLQKNNISQISTESVFIDQYEDPITAAKISTIGHRLIKACGLNGVVLYGLRHAIAVEMTEAGLSLEIVRQALGHSSLVQSSHYAKGISSTLVREAFTKIRSEMIDDETPPIGILSKSPSETDDSK